jgi:hypothetical protein
MPVPRPKLIRVEARAETQSFLVSLKFSEGGHRIREGACFRFVEGLTI